MYLFAAKEEVAAASSPEHLSGAVLADGFTGGNDHRLIPNAIAIPACALNTYRSFE
jgi:hypothetical protein